MSDELHRRTYNPHIHDDPGCNWPGCGGASDGSLDGEPFCIKHVELVIDRWVALSEYPEQARLLPALFDQ